VDAQGWDERYADAELVWSGEPNVFVATHLSGRPVGVALDLGAGEGRNAVWLAMQGWDVTAVDFSAVGLEKARREAEFPELRRPRREIWVEPTLADLEHFEREFIRPADDLSVDIETAQEQITCVGFAPSHERAIVVPFVDALKPDGNYWATLADELVAWSYVRRWLKLTKRIGGQNFLYDTHWLWRKYGLAVPHSAFDTMLMHHAMQPELEKGLGFLGTIYTDELGWKFMRAKHETLKKED